MVEKAGKKTAETGAYEARVVDSLDEVPAAQWQALAGGHPFVGHGFLKGLQDTGCVSPATGWYAQYILLSRDGELVGCAPCFFKTHSRGEFVFDQGWAEAFERNGIEYYPKLVVAAPFTPVPSPRLLAKDDAARAALARVLARLADSASASSVHILFVQETDRAALVEAGFMIREGVQFHWRNAGYGSLDDFLKSLTQEKRKKIRQDSRYVADAGISFECLEGEAITQEHLRFFYACYENTYKEHWSSPYLSFEFFETMHRNATLHLVMVLAKRDDAFVACALNVSDGETLYGRYWGTTEFVRGLHFETCYLQSIRYCIQRGLAKFEGGAQGEHKMARGLLPTKTFSAHWIADRRFADAILDFLQRETAAVEQYAASLQDASPYKA